MILINAEIKSKFIYFAEQDENNLTNYKVGRLKPKEFFKWLEDKTKIYDKLKINIYK